MRFELYTVDLRIVLVCILKGEGGYKCFYKHAASSTDGSTSSCKMFSTTTLCNNPVGTTVHVFLHTVFYHKGEHAVQYNKQKHTYFQNYAFRTTCI